MVAPFLARRIWDGRAPEVRLVECRSCSFLFFNPRLEPEEEQKLYTGYRRDEYQQMREACEPWYTEKFNNQLVKPEALAGRREKLRPILESQLAGIAQPKILDFGGDSGDLIAHLLPGARTFIYDISGVEAAPGVERCRDLSECKAQGFDMIVCSNVLEHIGQPRTIMDQIREIAGPQTKVFVEVPFESPFRAQLLLRRMAQWGVLAMTRPSIAVKMARPRMLYPMHEHINYFNARSLERMMEVSGLPGIASGASVFPGMVGGLTMGWRVGKIGSGETRGYSTVRVESAARQSLLA
jgi:2-polyprenyl-3-methyl-5-hydroxy-6-metoxy-1,4-benzoquinol methylase